MSLTFKLGSLVIRTIAKPVGSYIKRTAREHEPFRRRCVNFAQALHRIDMRMRLGILHDAAAQERLAAREAAESAAKKKQAEIPTVKTEAQMKAEGEDTAKGDKDTSKGSEKEKPYKPKIRPLSESKAIELGSNFIAETFVFGVAAGLLIWDSWRTRRKEASRREDVADRIESNEAKISELEAALESLKAKEAKLEAALARSSEAKGNFGHQPETSARKPDTKPKSKAPLHKSPEKKHVPKHSETAPA
ncbi:hypothetical protein B0A49_02315 [Cryomyces minteri]|uniref:OPA3-like protein n=1 Tax=Cryomyces minteri TaxID=331657 RepID=A0A4U0XIP5_9PEZI|nr:hypothetical protein B0A49_02315 [Cryomyces minteri]